MQSLTEGQTAALSTMPDDTKKLISLLADNRDDYQISFGLKMPLSEIGPAIRRIADTLNLDGNNPLQLLRQQVGGLWKKYLITAPSVQESPKVVPVKVSAPVDGNTLEDFGIRLPELVGRLSQIADDKRMLLSLHVSGMSCEEIEVKLDLLPRVPAMALGRLCSEIGIPKSLGPYRPKYLRIIGLMAIGEHEAADALLREVHDHSITLLRENQSRTEKKVAVEERLANLEDDIVRVAEKLRKIPIGLLRVAEALTEGVPIQDKLGISSASAMTYLSTLYRELDLGLSMRTVRKGIVVAAYTRFIDEKRKAQNAPPLLEELDVETTAEPKPVPNVHISGTPVDPSVSGKETAPEIETHDPQPTRAQEQNAKHPSMPKAEAAPQSSTSYGPGILLQLPNPGTIEDVEVVSRRNSEGAFTVSIKNAERRGFKLETFVIYPTNDPAVSVGHAVFIKRRN